ncbi:uncharacterized protein PGTG_13969 [Puccinia graminis f. sp. tritici CRL 75-36-700-3]|uniref:Uncharacterized protein n=1 Tax=Puccinia graminis f. sp. tritici (strain CRL 75-36-700-3 / race SCCL) TaxID=418459 RepID=E3KTH3_PUCGT|nr:uncharacterized protein PGTG_13969 [Puccinia graminis f. sp. tritici CRL 75-36-700-3]EFP87598.2 hypothetical protein PGTG_13969 [Puccinia graminis f. sp. tritici CRL 75-36-700-3]
MMNLTINLKDELPIGTLWLAFSRSKPIIQDGHRLENLSWRLWQRELKQNNRTLNLLINSIISLDPLQPITTSDQQSPSIDITPRPNSPPSQLHPPPKIINIAPTPPILASPAITPPTSSIITQPSLPTSAHQLPTLHQQLLLSPQQQEQQQQQPPSDSPSSSSYFTLQQPSRPSIDQHYSSGSNTSSSLATSPSIQAPPDNHLHQDHNKHIKQTVDRPKHTAHNLHPLPRRATSSTATFKHKRRPPVPTRLHSHQSTTRSVSPRLVQPYYCRRSSLPSSSPEQVQEPPKPLDPSHPTQLITSPSSVTHPHSSQNHPPQPSLAHDPDSQITLSAGYNSSGSLPSLVSPIIPETPNNSQVSAPFHVAEDGRIPDSLASSHTTGRSSAFMPSAPPPTPSQNGAPLPTTMSAGLKNKSKLIHHRGPLLPSTLPPINTSNAAPKKKAKFFIKEYEADDDNKTFSPTSFPAQPAVAQIAQGFTGTAVQPNQNTPPVITGEVGSAEKQAEKKVVQVKVEEEEEEEEGTDSDEWGSEYSDDETKEDDSRAQEQELEKKRKQEEYHRQLFAKKHFVQRNRSHDGSEDQPAPIRRAGLSMLFHPELNHLQHHPTSSSGAARQAGEPLGGPLRNQSAVELRRAGSSSSRKPGEGEGQGRASIGVIARPCSLIKSKSSVAVPVLAGQDPPVMVQRSPSSLSGNSSLRHRPPTRRNSAAPTAGPSTTANPQPPTRSLPHPAHQRHPSRLGGKPENIEYSEDSESNSEEGEGGSGGRDEERGKRAEQKRADQERRLGRLERRTGTNTEPIALGNSALLLANRPEPVAPPLSPRTTRRNMLANEMTESVRRNLLWERQIQGLALGVVPSRVEVNRSESLALGFRHHQHASNLPNSSTTTSTVDPSTSSSNNPIANPNQNPNNNNNNTGTTTATTTSTAAAAAATTSTQFRKTHLASLTNNNKEYRNFSKGFHRTGW